MAGLQDQERPEDEEELPDAPLEDGDPSTPAEKQRARGMGWVPEAEWDDSRGKRKPAHFWTAKEYIEYTQNRVPVMRETNRRMADEIAGLRSKLDDVAKLTANLYRQNKVAAQQGYERGKAEAEELKRQAIEAGDHSGVAKADKVLGDLERAKPSEEDDPPPERTNGKDKLNPATRAWIDAHPLFEADMAVNAEMIAQSNRVFRANPDMPERERYDMAWEQVKKMMPAKFGNGHTEELEDEIEEDIEPEPRRESVRKAPPATGRSTRGANGRRNERTFANLPKHLQDDYKRHAAYMAENSRSLKGGPVEYTKEEFLAGLGEDAWSTP